MMQAYPLPWKSGDKCAEYTTSGREASYARTVHSQLGYDERSCSYGLCAAGLKTTMYFDDDEIWDHRAQWLNHHCYFLYVRTRRALATDDGAMAALERMHGDRCAALSMTRGATTFIDGAVLNIWSKLKLEELKATWFDHLRYFEAWALHDGQAAFESVDGGLVDGGLVWSSLQALPHSAGSLKHLFPVFYAGDHEQPRNFQPDDVTDRIKSLLPVAARTVFHFRNGRVVLLRSDAPVRTMMRRLEGAFPRIQRRDGSWPTRRLHQIGFSGDDEPGGLTYYQEASIWVPTYPVDLKVPHANALLLRRE